MQLAIAALGLVGESGENADFIKKSLRNVKFPLQIDKIKLELGDVLYYVCTIATLLGISLDEIINANVEKLTARNEEGSIIDPTLRVHQYELFSSIDRPANWSERCNQRDLMDEMIATATKMNAICRHEELLQFCTKNNIDTSKITQSDFDRFIKENSEIEKAGCKPYIPVNHGIGPLDESAKETFSQSFKFDSTSNGAGDDGFTVHAVDLEGSKTEIKAESTDEPDNEVRWAFSESNKRDSLTPEQLAWREKMMAGFSVDGFIVQYPETEEKNITGQFDFVNTSAYEMIKEERWRQIHEEHRTAEIDDHHIKCELLLAATTYENCIYTKEIHGEIVAAITWPWHKKWFKPKNHVANLVRAGALVEAEIDRINRIKLKPESFHNYRSELTGHLRRICEKLEKALSSRKSDEE